MTPARSPLETDIRQYLLEEYPDTIAAALSAADAVAADWPSATTTDRSAVVPAYQDRLDEAGVLARFPALLTGAAQVADLALLARPVAAPPYVNVTSTGPVLRATAETGRLVISLRCFQIERGATITYRRASSDGASALVVAFHPVSSR